MSEERLTEAEWKARLEKVTKISDYEERQAKIDRISRDPKPEWSAEPARDYPTTEKHYIICVDEEKANESMPDAAKLYNEPHKFGGYLVSDRKNLPEGWFKALPRGTSTEVIKDVEPKLFNFFKEKKIGTF